MTFSIDQNCHSLWDVLPKLHALAAAGRHVRHLVEDIDAAFTALGADLDDGGELRVTRERFHHSGGSDWGAALFYTQFLGRQAVDPRTWEPFTGLKTAAIAKQLGRTVEDLFSEFSAGDNWQLVGPSFVGDRRHHRIIGDLTVRQTAPFLREIVGKARADVERAFPAAESRRRIAEWFSPEESLVGRLLAELADGTLVDLYGRWLDAHLRGGPFACPAGQVELGLTSDAFAAGGPAVDGDALARAFLAHYDPASALYNQAVEDSACGLRPLRTEAGELPLFATLAKDGHQVRTAVRLDAGRLAVGDAAFDLEAGPALPRRAMAAAGIRAIAGKAVLLVSQVRLGAAGRPLALPYRGSMYMPAAHLLARKLHAAGLLGGELKPVLRVRFRFLDRLRGLETPIRLPAHLAGAMGQEEVPASQLGESWAALAAGAAARLRDFRDEAKRRQWQRESFPQAREELDGLDARRRALAAGNPKDPELRDIWQRMRAIQAGLLEGLVRQIDRDRQVADLDYYDSRGALMPWCIALGGEPFYRQVVAGAEIYEESSLGQAGDHGRDG